MTESESLKNAVEFKKPQISRAYLNHYIIVYHADYYRKENIHAKTLELAITLIANYYDASLNYAYPSREKLAEKMHISLRTLDRAIEGLKLVADDNGVLLWNLEGKHVHTAQKWTIKFAPTFTHLIHDKRNPSVNKTTKASTRDTQESEKVENSRAQVVREAIDAVKNIEKPIGSQEPPF